MNRMDIIREFEEKRDNIPYPDRPQRPINGRVTDEQNANWREELKKYRKKVAEIDQQFKAAIFKFLRIELHPKANKLWYLAWQEGHANGYNEVFNYAEMFVELIE